MTKNENYEDGWRDGRNGSMRQSYDSEYRQGYSAGKQEYDYWNDKELYPSLRNDNSRSGHSRTQTTSDLSDTRVGGGTVLSTVFIWLMIFAPFALFSTWENWVVQLVFWTGIAAIILVFAIWLYGAAQEEQKSKDRTE